MRSLLMPGLFIIASVLMYGVTGCNKNNVASGTTTTTSLDITYTGAAIPGNTLSFGNTGPAANTYLWDFGDGSATSAQANPTHTYAYTGTYTVSLTINNNTDFVLRKFITVFSDPLYTHLLAGTRLWHHKMYIPSFGFGDTTFYADTSFAINYIDQLTVKIGNDTLFYTPNGDALLNFYHSYPFAVNTVYDLVLGFNNNTNAIYFNQYIRPSDTGATREIIYQWP